MSKLLYATPATPDKCNQCLSFYEQGYEFCAKCGIKLEKVQEVKGAKKAAMIKELMFLTRGLEASSQQKDTLLINDPTFTENTLNWMLYKPLFDLIIAKANTVMNADGIYNIFINLGHERKLGGKFSSNLYEFLRNKSEFERIAGHKLLAVPIICNPWASRSDKKLGHRETFLLILTAEEIEEALDFLKGTNWLLPEMGFRFIVSAGATDEIFPLMYSFARFFVLHEHAIKEWYRKKLMT